MKTNKKIIELGEKLKNRLSPELVMCAVEYINYNESPLALETLRDYIEEYDVIITHDEHNLLIEIAKELGIQLDTNDLIVK